MNFADLFPNAGYGDTVEYEDEELKKGNRSICQACGADTDFWLLFLMPYSACSPECLAELRRREDAG